MTWLNNQTLLFLIIGIYPFAVFADQPVEKGKFAGEELQYIQDKANDFLQDYNKEHQTHWKALPSNVKMMVAQCNGHMSAKWGRRFMNGYKMTIEVERYVVFVTCHTDQNGDSWTVDVPTTRPDRVTVH